MNHNAENDAPGRIRRLLLRVQRWAEAEQHRRDIKCWHRGHDGSPCRRCGCVLPPEGWLPFGSLIDHDGPREFSDEAGDDGLPLWERPIPPEGSKP